MVLISKRQLLLYFTGADMLSLLGAFIEKAAALIHCKY